MIVDPAPVSGGARESSGRPDGGQAPGLGALAERVAELAVPAGATLMRTLLGLGLLAPALAYTAYRLAAPRSPAAALLVAVLVVVATAALAVPLAAKRALGRAIVIGIRRHQLGLPLLRLLFERLLGVVEGPAGAARADAAAAGAGAADAHGERGGRLARTVERLPLRQAEEALRRVVEDWTRSGSGRGGWLARRIEARLLAAISQLTVAHLRDHDARHGGVDLLRVRDELAAVVDERVSARVQGSVTTLTVTLLAALVAGAVLLGYAGGLFGQALLGR
jgi:hypothetical protein